MSDTDSSSDRVDWDAVGYTLSSEYRVATLQHLADSPDTPKGISNATDNPVSNVSRAINELRDRDLIQLLVSEDTKKGRVYTTTEKGDGVWAELVENDLHD